MVLYLRIGFKERFRCLFVSFELFLAFTGLRRQLLKLRIVVHFRVRVVTIWSLLAFGEQLIFHKAYFAGRKCFTLLNFPFILELLYGLSLLRKIL
jgi:hypothetical protein